MATAATSARLRYLQHAVSRLFLTAPTSAAALEAEISNIADKAGLALPHSRRQQVCGACGSSLVPGISCTLLVKPASTPTSKPARRSRMHKLKRDQLKPNYQTQPKKIMIYTCKRCSRSTHISAGASPKAMKIHNPSNTTKSSATSNMPTAERALDSPHNGKPQEAKVLKSSTVVSATSDKGLGNGGSKQRARPRKQSGLQALLAKNKEDTRSASTGGLDLMDFMKMG